jgi:hypothetical protein
MKLDLERFQTSAIATSSLAPTILARKKAGRKTIPSKVICYRDHLALMPHGFNPLMDNKPLMIVSLNVKSLRRNSSKQKEIKAWTSSLFSLPQILLLQEHHLGEVDYANFTRGIEF